MAKRRQTDIFIEDGLVENIEEHDYSALMSKAFMSYAMSIIVARALPNIKDGLKPVQRRVLHSMDELRIYHNTAYKKSARIVGDTMGKYHPHGDSSIYTALVNMAQPFKRNERVVDGHGNFGSMEGDTEAAMRYTEARLTKFAKDTFLDGNNKHVVPYSDNYDQSEREPEVLPAKVPYALLNGADGIAVGMTTAIPPHNLGEIIDALSYVLKSDNPTVKGVLKRMPGPDFPTGGIITNLEELENIYTTGRGVVKVRGTVEFEVAHTDKETKKRIPDALVITSVPYTMIGEELPKFLTKVEELSTDGTLSEITNIENHSLGEDIRIVFYLKKNADLDYVLNTLYKKTKLESSYGTSFLVIDNGQPVRYPINQLLQRFGEEQKIVHSNRLKYRLEKAEKQKEIDEGLLKAISIINVIMEIAQGSKSAKQTKECLMTGNAENITFQSDITKMIASQLNFSEVQADAILRLTISRMVGLETEAIQLEYDKLVTEISNLKDILSDDSLLVKEIVKDLKTLKKEYANERRTALDNLRIKKVEKAKEEIEQVVLIDNFGYAHHITKAVYEKNKEAADSDYSYVVQTTNMRKLFILTDKGNVHWVRVEDIPGGSLRFKGEPLDNLTKYKSSEEVITGILSIEEDDKREVLITTSDGYIKRMPALSMDTSRKQTTYTKLNDHAHVVSSNILSEEVEVVVGTNDSHYARLTISDIKPKERNARGITAIKLNDKASVNYVNVIEKDTKEIVINDKVVKLSQIKPVPSGRKGTKL